MEDDPPPPPLPPRPKSTKLDVAQLQAMLAASITESRASMASHSSIPATKKEEEEYESDEDVDVDDDTDDDEEPPPLPQRPKSQRIDPTYLPFFSAAYSSSLNSQPIPMNASTSPPNDGDAADSSASSSEEMRLSSSFEPKQLKGGPRPLTMMVFKSMSSIDASPRSRASLNSNTTSPRTDDVITGYEVITDKDERIRLQVINEILVTEKDYVNDLELIVKAFLEPIREQQLVTKKDMETIFGNLETIRGVNETLKRDLEKGVMMSVDDNFMVGKIFIVMCSFLKSYNDYVDRQDESLRHIDKCKKKYPKFAEFLKKTEYTETTRNLSLNSFLIKPMQRITKYPLLIRELKKNTKPDHADYENISLALAQLETVAQSVNERKRQSENRQKILDIIGQLSGVTADKIIAPNRFFIREDTLYKISKGKKQERHFYLFNDLLLYGAKSGGNKVNYKGKIELDKTVCNDLPNDEKNGFSFELWRLDLKKKKYVICCKNLTQKKAWMADLKKNQQHLLDMHKQNVNSQMGKGSRLNHET